MLNRLLLCLLLAIPALPAWCDNQANALANVSDALNRVNAVYKVVSSGQGVNQGNFKGQLSDLSGFLANFVQAVQNLNLSEASRVQDLSIKVKVKIDNAEQEMNAGDLIKLAADFQDLSLSMGDLQAALQQLYTALRITVPVADLVTPTPLPAGTPSPTPIFNLPPVFALQATPIPPTPFPTPTSPSGVVIVPGTSQAPSLPQQPGPVLLPGNVPPPLNNPGNTGSSPAPISQPTPASQHLGPTAMVFSQDLHRLFVANSYSNSVTIISSNVQRQLGRVTVGSNPVALALSQDSQVLAVADAGSNDVTLLGQQGNKGDEEDHSQPNSSSSQDGWSVLGKVSVGSRPVDLVFSRDGHMIYVVNQGSNTVSVVLVDKKAVLKTLSVGFTPSRIVLSENGGEAYISNTDSDSVSILSTSANEIVSSVSE